MTDENTTATARREPEKQGLTVIGLAASAGNIGSLATILNELQLTPEEAAILVFQHREALDEQHLRDLLSARSAPWGYVEDGKPLEGGRIYICHAAHVVTVRNGHFAVQPGSETANDRGEIDSLLLSLADQFHHNAIAVVLHGTAGEGTLGTSAVKENGGLTFAELASEEAGADLSSSNSPAAIADFLLPAEFIAERIRLHAQQLAVFRSRRGEAAEMAQISGLLGQIATILQGKTGHDFHGYKPQTFLRRIQRRMQVAQIDTIGAYAEHLRAHPEEVQNLFNDLLIGVTQFFRDPKEFEALEKDVIPRILEGRRPADLVRVWVLGCATGEEAYSIGILIREQMSALEVRPHVQIFATDIDARALAAARVGRYPESIVRDVSPERLARWFVREGNTYVVAKELREMCIFSAHNVIRDAPFSRLDLISCRNLLIYLKADLQDRLMPLFHFALRPDRYLFLGGSENVTRHGKLFAPINRRARVFKRLNGESRGLPDFPLSSSPHRGELIAPAPGRRMSDDMLARQAERIAERYAPAYVIVDENFEILHFSGRTGRFIEPESGAASLELLSVVHRDLRPDLRATLMKAAETDQPIRVQNLAMDSQGARVLVDLVVEPMRDRPGGRRNFVIVFMDGPVFPENHDALPAAPDQLRDEHVNRLEGELQVTRDRLQATIEELESTNEELKSSNEEYQSLNEELQSANEELETSREELQSVNEELTTVNGELAHRVHELTRATSDLKNFLESTQIATLFLDNELKVMNFTPAVTEIFHLIESDVGRPISHIRSRLPFEDLQDDIRRVLRTLSSIERDMENPVTGKRYIVRILPYRSIDNFIAGVVITFVDVTPLTQAEKALRESEERFRNLTELSPDGILIAASDQISYANAAAATLLGAATPDELRGRPLSGLVRERDREALNERLGRVRQGDRLPPMEFEFLGLKRDGLAPVEVTAGLINWEGKKAAQLLLRYVGERRRAQARQNLLLAELQHRVRNTMTVIRSIARRTAENSKTVAEYREKLDGRLKALGRTQALITRDPSAGVNLGDLLADELSVAEVQPSRVRVNCPAVTLTAKMADNIGIAVHELTTNALKYGSLSHKDGILTVDCAVLADAAAGRLLTLSWKEEGGPEPGRAPTEGFGMQVLNDLLRYELHAQTECAFEKDGVRWSIRIPLDR